MANRKLIFHLLLLLVITECFFSLCIGASLEKAQIEPSSPMEPGGGRLDTSVIYRAKELAGKQFQKIIVAYFHWNRNNSEATTTTKNPYDKEGLRF